LSYREVDRAGMEVRGSSSVPERRVLEK
jgi:hypothetical protein